MTAPVESRELLANDVANTGKNLRSQTKLVNGFTVHEEFFVPSMSYNPRGHYFFSSPQQTVLTNQQDGINSAFYFLYNPSSSSVVAVLRRINLDSNILGGNFPSTNTVISFTKFTYSGTPTAATIVAYPAITTQPWPQLCITQSSTGMLPIYDLSDFGQIALHSTLSGTAGFYQVKEILTYNPFAYSRGMCLELAAGEGISVYQLTAGNTSEARKFGIQIEWDEVDLI